MHYVYVIQSTKNHAIYIGCTADLRRRFKEHNDGQTTATRNKCPWELIYYEAYNDKRDAEAREKSLKHHGSAIGHLKNRLKFSRDRKGGERRTAA